MDPEPTRISTKDARAGVTLHRIRYVLLASLVLAVIAMVVLYKAAPATDGSAATMHGMTQP